MDLAADSEDLGELLREQLGASGSRSAASERQGEDNSGFQPLLPPQFKSVPAGMDGDELAKAVRHLTSSDTDKE